MPLGYKPPGYKPRAYKHPDITLPPRYRTPDISCRKKYSRKFPDDSAINLLHGKNPRMTVLLINCTGIQEKYTAAKQPIRGQYFL